GQFGRYWRKSAREAGSEKELGSIAVARLEALNLVRRENECVVTRAALARYATDAKV
ncbi:MAG: DUF2398 family protein, partial [Burkholderiales bacterium]